MKLGLLRGLAMNPFDAADYSAGEANHIYTAIERDYRDLSLLLPKLLDRQLIPVLIQVYCGTRISEVRKRKREDFDLVLGTMQIALGTAKNKASVRTIPLPPKVVELLKLQELTGFEMVLKQKIKDACQSLITDLDQ